MGSLGGRAVVLLVLAMMLAGCGGTAGDGGQTTPTPTGENGGTGDGNETEEPPPEPQEVLNETLDYARAPEEAGESANFDVPADSVGLRLTFQGQHDCPTPSLGYRDEAQVVFVDPNGEEYREDLFGPGAAGSGSGSVDCNNPPLVHTINPEPVAGSWEVRAEGVYTGMVHVTALANPPESSA